MNITVGNKNFGHLVRNLNARYVASAASAMLVLSALAGFSGALGSTTSAKAPSQPSARNVPATRGSAVAPVLVLVVDTVEQEAAMQLEQLSMLNVAATAELPLPPHVTIVIRGSALEQDLLGASGTVAATGQTVVLTN